MIYDDHFKRDDYDPSRVDAKAYDDRDEPATPDLMEQAAWNEPEDAVAHL